MRVTVGITTHNYAKLLPIAINSALSQGAEVIVVDNGSTDDTPQIMSMYEDNPNLSYYRMEEPTVNQAAPSNEIIKRAEGDFIIFLDADDFLAPGAIRTFVENMDGYDIVYSDMNLVDDEGLYMGYWSYKDHPRDYDGIIKFAREMNSLPVSMKGMFRTSFIKDNDLKYLEWDTTFHASDFRTCMDWIEKHPVIGHIEAPLYNYRYRGDNLPQEHRDKIAAELETLIGGNVD